ncbi:hypothetical protein [Profundibacter sp.]
MFQIAANPEFTHNVPVMVPVDGGHEEKTLSVRYRVLPADEAEMFDLNTAAGTVDFLNAVIVSIDDVAGDDGKPLPYNDKLRDKLLDLYFVRIAIVNGYLRAVMKARVGN